MTATSCSLATTPSTRTQTARRAPEAGTLTVAVQSVPVTAAGAPSTVTVTTPRRSRVGLNRPDTRTWDSVATGAFPEDEPDDEEPEDPEDEPEEEEDDEDDPEDEPDEDEEDPEDEPDEDEDDPEDEPDEDPEEDEDPDDDEDPEVDAPEDDEVDVPEDEGMRPSSSPPPPQDARENTIMSRARAFIPHLPGRR